MITKENDSVNSVPFGVYPSFYNQFSKKAIGNNYTFVCGDVETARPDRSIPLSELYRKFVSGESISDVRMSSLSYNQIEGNPFKRKGLDLADLPQIKRENLAILEKARDDFENELKAIEEAKLAQQQNDPAPAPNP